MQPDSLDRLETLARIGSSLAGVQFEAASFEPSHVTDDPFVFGYCFGLLDAMAQYANLDQYEEAAPMMGNAFGKLVGDDARGMALFGQAIDLQSQSDFAAGMEAGAADLNTWAADANALPTALTRHISGRAKQ